MLLLPGTTVEVVTRIQSKTFASVRHPRDCVFFFFSTLSLHISGRSTRTELKCDSRCGPMSEILAWKT